MDLLILKKSQGIFLLILFLTLIFTLFPCVNAQVESYEVLGDAYAAIYDASEAGADVDALVSRINLLIMEIDGGLLTEEEIQEISNSIIVDSQMLMAEAVAQGNFDTVLRITVTLTALFLSYIVWRRLPGFFWRSWLRLRGDWRVQG